MTEPLASLPSLEIRWGSESSSPLILVGSLGNQPHL